MEDREQIEMLRLMGFWIYKILMKYVQLVLFDREQSLKFCCWILIYRAQ